MKIAAIAAAILLVACQQHPAPSPIPIQDAPEDSEEAPRYPGDDDTYDTTQMPDDHTVDWLRRHGAVAMGQGNDCAVCHAEEDCIECHVESLDEPHMVHPPNYEVVHATDARQGLQDCTSCHRPDTFCEACHIQSGVSPAPEHSPPSTVDFHPPDWLDPAAPDNHATQARRDIVECASCHIEQDCIACHRGINPHPPEFQFNCGHLVESDPSSCVQCHTETIDELRRLCL